MALFETQPTATMTRHWYHSLSPLNIYTDSNCLLTRYAVFRLAEKRLRYPLWFAVGHTQAWQAVGLVKPWPQQLAFFF
jgi:hypothetical protein